METGMLHLHSVLRWVILVFLVLTLIQAFSKNETAKKTSLWLMIAAHTMLLVGIYQLIAGRYGITKGMPEGVELMKNKFYRFYWIEHPLMMFISIVLITMARGKLKRNTYTAAAWMLLVALLLILAAIPWPFREVVGEGRKWLPGM
jgi:cytochrome bd-type quinol oxidase subunit 2